MTSISGAGSQNVDNEAQVEMPQLTPAEHHVHKNTVIDDHGNVQHGPPKQGSPTDGGRELTVRDEAQQRIAEDPDCQELEAQFASWKSLGDDWNLVEANSLMANDGILTKADIQAVADDPLRPQGVRDAARRLLSNSDFLTAVNKDDTIANAKDVADVIAGVKAALKARKNEITEEVRAERGVKSGNGGATGSAAGEHYDMNAGQAAPPPPSNTPGVDGAIENLANKADWTQGEIDRLANDLLEHPENAAAINAKISKLNNQLVAMTALQKQLTETQSNLAKLWSDVSENAIRNLK